MATEYFELEDAAQKLVELGNLRGAEAVRRAAARLTACDHEIDRLLVDVEQLSKSLQNERART